MLLFGPKTGYDAWKEDKKKKKPQKSVVENPIQYVDRNFQSKSETGNYKWETENLRSLPNRTYGRSYNDKFNNFVKAMGGSESDAAGFRKWLDAREKGVQTQNDQTNSLISDVMARQNAKPISDNNNPFYDKAAAEKNEKLKQKRQQPSLLNDVLTPLRRYKEGVQNIFDGDPNTTFTGAFKNAVNDAKSTDRSKVTKEVTRGLTRVSNSALLGALDEAYKKTHNGESAVQFQSRNGGGKAADFAYDALGLFAPGAGAYKGAKALGLGAKAGSKGAARVGQLAKEGAAAGALLGIGQVATREAINGKDYSAKDNARDILLNAALGGVGDPLLVGGNQLLKGASEKAIKKLLPDSKDLGKRLGDAYMTGEKTNLPTSKPIHGSLADRLRVLSPERKLPDFSNAKSIVEKPNESIISKHYGIDVPQAQKDLVESAPKEYWQKRYEDFAKYVNQNYDTNKLTKEGLDELWTHFAKPDEPVNLEQLAELAYKDYKPNKAIDTNEVWGKLGNRKSVSNNALKKMGISRMQEPKSLLENIRPAKNEIASSAEKIVPQVENGGSLNRVDSQEPIPKPNNTDPLKEIKDITPFQVGTKNIYELADRLPKAHGDAIRNSLDTAKKNYVSHLEQETNDLYNTVVKGMGIKNGSKESALVQDFGEKTLGKKYLRKQGIDPKEVSPEELDAANLQQLQKLSPNKWQKIVEADKFFREKYDSLIEQVNKVRGEIYPTSPDKLVPKRNDYYHHFNELNGFEGVKNLFSNPANIDPRLEGLSPYTQPKSKWQGFMQKRGVGPYKSDAVGGFLKYVRAASHSINVDQVIPVLRGTAKDIANATTDSKNANKIIEALVDHANDLAGKTNPYDRLAQKVLGRGGAWKAVNWLNSRVRSNMILGNLGTVVAQYGNLPWGIGKAKWSSLPGLKNTLKQTTKELFHGEKNDPIYQSTFMKERYQDHLFRRFDQKLLQQPKKFAVWAMETADQQATRFIWNSLYHKAKKEGIKDAVKYADYETRKTVAGRGIGEVPILQKAKTFQVFAPFTLEVGNQWKVLSQMVGKKDAAGIITALVASYGINKAAEEIRGSSGVSFDPIDAIIEGYMKKDGNVEQKSLHALASLAGESIGNIPGGNILTQMVNTEKRIPFTDLKFKDAFGERNPNRYGTGLVLSKAFEDPAYVALPFGASQMRKTSKGLDALKNKGVYVPGNNPIPYPIVDGPKKKLMYPVNPNTFEKVKLPLFGPSATSDAKAYYDNKRVPLNETQTDIYRRLGKEEKTDLYNFLRIAKNKPSLKGKITRVEKNQKLSDEEKLQKFIDIMNSVKK